jgi:hypothetical protein
MSERTTRRITSLINSETINTLDIRPNEELRRNLREDPDGFFEKLESDMVKLSEEAQRQLEPLGVIPLEKRNMVIKASA